MAVAPSEQAEQRPVMVSAQSISEKPRPDPIERAISASPGALTLINCPHFVHSK